MATTLKEKQEKGLRKKLHVLFGKAGIGQDGKEAIYGCYKVNSSTELNYTQLMELCSKLELQVNPELAKMDKARKLLMASIGGWLRAMGTDSNSNKIKAIACRAAGRDSFNGIPLEQLRSLYAAFNKKQKDLKNVEDLTAEQLDYLSTLN